jgi:hypothetical protein
MGVIEGGISGNVAEVDGAFAALHVTERPQSAKGQGGSYRIAATSGLVTGASLDATPDPIFSWRWGSSTKFCLVRYLDVQLVLPTSVTAAQEIGGDIIYARTFTASDSGGTALTLTGANAKKKTGHNTSAVTDARIATTTDLTAGTRTLDSQPFAAFRDWELATAATVPHQLKRMTFDARNPGLYPIVLQQDTGFIVRNTLAMTASGTQRWVVTVEWDEYLTAEYLG